MPVRYVLAVALATGLLGVSYVGLNQWAGTQGEQHVESELDEIERLAASLIEAEDVPPAGRSGAQRTMTLEMPRDSWTSEPIEYVRITRVENGSVAEFTRRGGPTIQRYLDAPIVGNESDTVEFRGTGTTYDLRLILETDDDGHPVVRISTR